MRERLNESALIFQTKFLLVPIPLMRKALPPDVRCQVFHSVEIPMLLSLSRTRNRSSARLTYQHLTRQTVIAFESSSENTDGSF